MDFLHNFTPLCGHYIYICIYIYIFYFEMVDYNVNILISATDRIGVFYIDRI